MTATEHESDLFDDAAERVIELGNRLLDANESDDAWDIASGLLAGAVQFWLYSRQPCGDPTCESCEDINTAEQRMRQLLDEVEKFSKESDYYHSPGDVNVGTA